MPASDQQPRSIFIPAPGCFLEREAAPRSAIVGLPISDEQRASNAMIIVDLEGNLNNAVNLQRFHERVLNAWSRQATRYPTAGRMGAHVQDVIEIGRTDSRGGIEWLDLAVASAWAQEPPESLIAPLLSIPSPRRFIPPGRNPTRF